MSEQKTGCELTTDCTEGMRERHTRGYYIINVRLTETSSQ